MPVSEPTYLTADQVAAELGMPRGTFSRRLAEHNKRASNGGRILPDKIEDHSHYRKHFFDEQSLPRIREALTKQPDRPRGRPRKTKGTEEKP